jgi:hypothetical protein
LCVSAKSDAIKGLESVFKALSENNLICSLSKCNFCQSSVTFLCYTVSNKGLAAISNKLIEIAKYSMPKCLKSALRFCGITTYYTRFIPKLQLWLSLLQKLIGKKGQFEMTPEAIEGVKGIQKSAEKGCHVHHLDYGKNIFVATDTSLHGIGGVFGNYDDLNKSTKTMSNIKISAYTSRCLDAKEALLSSRARE